MWNYALLSVLLAMPTSAPLESFERLRAPDPFISELVERGRVRSATFERLAAEIEAHDWIVYVFKGRCQHRAIVGCMRHLVGHYQGRPYLRVVVDVRGRHPDQVIATIAHELRHALEVITAGTVRDAAAMRAHFARIGRVSVRTRGMTAFETEAAERAGHTVLAELIRDDHR